MRPGQRTVGERIVCGALASPALSFSRLLSWKLTYKGVGANPLKIADGHYGKPGQFGPILFRLCGPCKSGQTGKKSISAVALRSIRAGTGWVTVITGTYPNGVIRGQIKVS